MTTARAFAKLTLSLRVLGRRADGYHELDALTIAISEPHDELTIELGGDVTALELTGPAAAGVTADADNLAVRAAEAMRARARAAGRDSGVRIRLHKEIPAGAGLGGGSADAAAVLRALDARFELDSSIDELAALGATLGADVPVCVHGGAQRMRGVGDLVEPAAVPPLHALVAVPPFAIATPAVYRMWDDLGGPQAARAVGAPGGLRALVNDLEPAAERVEPRLIEFREQLERVTGAGAVLAGSGSACVVLYAEDDRAAAVAARDRVRATGIASTCVLGYFPC